VNVTSALLRNALVTVIARKKTKKIMIEFLLVFMIGNEITNRTQIFSDINKCIYFAEKLNKQPSIPTEDGNKRITAYCKPIPKRRR
jgi:hypothetical protein